MAVAVLVLVSGCSSGRAAGDSPPTLPSKPTAVSRVSVTTEDSTTTTTTTARPRGKYADRVPHFADPPAPEKITFPAGAWLSRIPTTQKVAFITIDDGYVRHPEALDLIRDSGVPVSLFLISSVAKEDPKFFSDIDLFADATIEAHTVSHAKLRGKSYAAQKQEICGSADQLQQLFGTRPTLFRAPGGLKDATTLQAAADCGMKAVLFWHEAVNNGQVQFQEGAKVQPGDVILMHFRQTFVEDYLAALQGIKDAGLTPARLEDYIA